MFSRDNVLDRGGRRIILDPSYIHASNQNGGEICYLVSDGGCIVLIDNFIFERCTNDNANQWPATQRKLAPSADSIECWYHVGEMLRIESDTGRPFGSPVNFGTTQRFQEMLRNNAPYVPKDLSQLLSEPRAQREMDSAPALFRRCRELALLLNPVCQRLRHSSSNSDRVTEVCDQIINNPVFIRRIIESDGIFQSSLVDERWVAWHQYRACWHSFVNSSDSDVPISMR